MSDLRGKKILVTGAASGIGALMSQSLADKGAELILWDINAQALADVSAGMTQKGAKVDPHQIDLTSRTSIEASAATVLEKHGKIDVVINNAGIVIGKPLLELTSDEIERTFQVNSLALFWVTRSFLPKMIESNSGHIVTIASAAGIVGTAKLVDYCASKHAAVGFDEALRQEFSALGYKGIKTTIICPFYIDTGMFRGVKTRFSFLLPILKPEYVVRKTVRAIMKNQKRVIMPRFVQLAYVCKVLPLTLYDWLMGFLGINKSMEDFKGRK